MNLGEMKAWLRHQSHRTDLDGQLVTFVNRAQENIRRWRDGAPATELLLDQDSNQVSAINPNLILYGAMVELNMYIHDTETAVEWEDRFRAELLEMNVNYHGDGWPKDINYVISEDQREVLDELEGETA